MLGIATSDESATYCIPTGGKKDYCIPSKCTMMRFCHMHVKIHNVDMQLNLCGKLLITF
jgi:hypothetical protein